MRSEPICKVGSRQPAAGSSGYLATCWRVISMLTGQVTQHLVHLQLVPLPSQRAARSLVRRHRHLKWSHKMLLNTSLLSLSSLLGRHLSRMVMITLWLVCMRLIAWTSGWRLLLTFHWLRSRSRKKKNRQKPKFFLKLPAFWHMRN